MRFLLFLSCCATFVLGACFDGRIDAVGAGTLRCASGDECPGTDVCLQGRCVDAGGACLTITGRDAVPQEDGNACDVGDQPGICVAGACVVPRCGDGVVSGRETCEPGGGVDDGCRADCTRCGDGVLDESEGCDEGAQNGAGAGACRATCVPFSCGDGVKDPGEGCDDGDDNSAVLADACRPGVCARSSCGDGVVDDGEDCDDGAGNATIADACRPTCARPACGDGVIDRGEACDDGVANADLRPNACRTSCALPRCGDGTRDADEACDDGDDNGVGPGACRPDCVLPRCGDGVIDPGEVCDDDNVASGDGCRGDCLKVEVCGDVVIDAGEACDDGNDNPVDGCDGCRSFGWAREVLVRGSVEGTDGVQVQLGRASAVAVDRLGRIFVADTIKHQVRRLDPDGSITTVAGTGVAGFDGDNLPAPSSRLSLPNGVAVDTRGRIFISDQGNRRVRMVDAEGIMTTLAGTGQVGAASGNGILAIQARISAPTGIAVDGFGIVYFADTLDHRVRFINTNGLIGTIAGTAATSGFAGDGLSAATARLNQPVGVAVDVDGSVLIADMGNHRIRRVRSGVITTVAGTGAKGFGGDGGPAIDAIFDEPTGVALDAMRRILIADATNNRVRRIDVDGAITTIAGTGFEGFDGDFGPATAAVLSTPFGAVDDGAGGVVIADGLNTRVRRVDGAGVITTVIGSDGRSDDGSDALRTRIIELVGIAIDRQGRLAFSDNASDRIRRVELDGTVRTIAGIASSGFSGDGGPAVAAALANPGAMVADDDGALIVCDVGNHRVRRIDAAGVIATIAGTGVPVTPGDDVGDGGPAEDAALREPAAVSIDGQGRLLIAECGGHRVRRVDTDGAITTIAGTGVAGVGAEDVVATSTPVSCPLGAIDDGAGGVLFVEQTTHRVRRVDGVTGIVQTVAGTGTSGFLGDEGPAIAARLSGPVAILADGAGGYFIADLGNRRVRHVDDAGTITTVAGSGVAGQGGDFGPAILATGTPNDLARDAAGNLYFPDPEFDVVRRVDVAGTITTVAGELHPLGPGPFARSALYGPRHFARVGGLTLASGDRGRVLAVDDAQQRVDVVFGYPSATPAVQGLARTAPLLGRGGGLALDDDSGTLWLIDQFPAGLRQITVDIDDDGTLDEPSTWTTAVVPLPADHGLFSPGGAVFEPGRGTLVVADQLTHCVRRIDPAGVLPSEPVFGECTTRGVFPGLLDSPNHVARSPVSGALYISDANNNRVLRLDPDDDSATVILGDGSRSSAGDGAPARLFPVDRPGQLALDEHGNLFVTSRTTVRLVANVDGDDDADGDDRVITIFGGGGSSGFPESASACLTALVVLDDGRVQVGDACQGFLVELQRVERP